MAIPFMMSQQGRAMEADASTNTPPMDGSLSPVPSTCSSSSSLVSLLLLSDGARAGAQRGGDAPSRSRKTRTAPEEVPTSEIDLSMRKEQGQGQEQQQALLSPVDASSSSKQEGRDNKALEEEEDDDASSPPVTPPPPPHPHHRRNADWLHAFDASSIAADEISAEEQAVLESLAFHMGAQEEEEAFFSDGSA